MTFDNPFDMFNRAIGRKPKESRAKEGTGHNEMTTVEMLAKGSFFSGLNASKQQRLAKLFVPRSYPANTDIIKEGSTGLGMFLIIAGEVEVYKLEAGERLDIARLKTGDFIGEMALIDDEPRSASVRAIDDCECLLLTRDSFRRLVAKDPAIAWSLVPTLANRLRTAQERPVKATAAEPNATPAASATTAPEATSTTTAPEPCTASSTTVPEAHEVVGSELVTEIATISSPKSHKKQDSALWSFAVNSWQPMAALMSEMAQTCAAGLEEVSKQTSLKSNPEPKEILMKVPQGMAQVAKAVLTRGMKVPGNIKESICKPGHDGDACDNADVDLEYKQESD